MSKLNTDSLTEYSVNEYIVGMKKRKTRRAEAAEETRQRIVQATFDLHGEKGIPNTSHRDVAQRAGVAVGTVYHHFPTTDQLVEACGAYTLDAFPTPGLDVLDGATGPGDRLRRVVAAWCDHYRAFPGMARVRVDRDQVPPLAAVLDQQAASLRQQLAAVVAPQTLSPRVLAVLATLLDIGTYQSLVDAGLPHSAVVDEIVSLAEARLFRAEPAPRGVSP